MFSIAAEHDPGGKVKLPVPAHWKADAIWGGENREYRQFLRYVWRPGVPVILWCLMNPSTASERALDSTLAKCGRLSERWGYGGFTVVNACDYRVTDSKLLRHVAKPASAENIPVCESAATEAGMILVGYGNLHKSLQPHSASMVRALRASGKPLHVLRLGKTGFPVHPLYQREDTVPFIWEPGWKKSQ